MRNIICLDDIKKNRSEEFFRDMEEFDRKWDEITSKYEDKSRLEWVKAYKKQWHKEHGNVPFDETAKNTIIKIGARCESDIINEISELKALVDEYNKKYN